MFFTVVFLLFFITMGKMYLLIVLVMCIYFLEVSSVKMIRMPLKKNQRTISYIVRVPPLSNNETNSQNPDPVYKGNYTRLLVQMDYYATISIGTPPQKFKVLIDIAGNTFWVLSNRCESEFCKLHNRYSEESSLTNVKNGTNFDSYHELTFAMGVLFTDTMIIGDQTVKNQIFGEAFVTSGDLKGIVYDGVFSLNYNQPMVTTFIEKLWSQDLLDKPVFSLYLNRDETSSAGGELILGGTDDSKHSTKFTYLPIADQRNGWILKIDMITVRGKEMSKSYFAQLTTASTGIYGPKDQIFQLNRMIGAKPDPKGDYYQVSCEKLHILPVVFFYLGGEKFSLEGKDYIKSVRQNGRTVCLSVFRDTFQNDDMWLLGNIFLRNYYTVFDFEHLQIGFSEVVDDGSLGHTTTASFIVISLAALLLLSLA